MEKGVPVLLTAESARQLGDARALTAEYEGRMRFNLWNLVDRFFAAVGDFRSRGSREAYEWVAKAADRGGLWLSVGGGPRRCHPAFVTLNIGPFDNVDVIGDAQALPYADACVDGIECEAVFEHLEQPWDAVAEFFRVLRPGGRVFAVTPFLQKYHGYPGHFQDFTLQGHRRLFLKAGFEVEHSGTCVGAGWVVSDLTTEFVGRLVPIRGLRAAAMFVARCVLLPLRFVDVVLNRSPEAHVMASTTFVLARKPAAGSACCNTQ